MAPSTLSFTFPEQPVSLHWNGLLLLVPPSWNPAVLDKNYLLAEDDFGPVMEVKWGWVRGRLSFDMVLRKLTRELKGAEIFSGDGEGGQDDMADAVPEPWAAAVAELEVLLEGQGGRARPFFWKVRDPLAEELPARNITAGRGAVVHAQVPGLAWMIQFYETGGRAIAEDAVSVLRSLRPPDSENWLPWEVFGIRFQVPGWLELAGHSFKPGRYRLEFRKQGWKSPTRLILERIGPARAVLKGASLREWAQGFYAGELRSVPVVDAGRSSVEARWEKSPGAFSRRGARAAVRLSDDGRMILALFLLHARSGELNEFGRIWSAYATIPRNETG